MYVTAIVVAAGSGRRLGSRIPKPVVQLNRVPVIIYSLTTLSRHPLIKDIILVANRRNFKDILNKIRKYRIRKIRGVVLGGRLRQYSVRNGLKAIDSCTELVLIHDGARPFIDKRVISSAIEVAGDSGAAIAGVPVKATIKKVRSQKSKVKIVAKTIDRNSLWEIQTPQVFKKELILKAYKKFGRVNVTDDAMLVEKLGAKVSLVEGSYNNIKITTPEDLVSARAIAKKWITA